VSAETLSLRTGELVYGLVVAVDIEGFSKLSVLDQSAAQTLLEEVLNRAATAAGLTREDWRLRQPRGDGELAVLPADTDVALVVADFTDQLANTLRDLRSDPRVHPKLRIRVAMHHGALTAGRFGLVGETPIVACRLLDAGPTKAALIAEPACDLVLVTSRQLYQEVVATRFHGLASERFRPMRARIKGRTYAGYLCLGTPKRVIGSP
jgi:class 3 adenylate cyclase